MVENKAINFEEESEAFRTTFSILKDQLGSDSMRKFDARRDKFLGGFLISAFEVVALGMGYNYMNPKNDIVEAVKAIWSSSEITTFSGSGVSASRRIPKTIPLGRKVFAM